MAKSELPRSILIVEDNKVLRRRMARAFRQRGYDTREATGYEEALAAAREEPPEFMVVDLRMPGKSGIEVIRDVKALEPATVAVVLTGYGSIATALEAVRAGAADYLTKPADVDRIAAALEAAANGEPVPVSAETGAEVPSLARVEWEHINRVMSDCGGNISKTARLLGIHRRSLQRKLTKYPMQR